MWSHIRDITNWRSIATTFLLCSLICGQFHFSNGDTELLTILWPSNRSAYLYEVFSEEGKPAIDMLENGKTNLTAITWAHAVNSQQYLTDTLNSTIDMIEADIVLGRLNLSGPTMPVMAHPPAIISDISLAEFLQRILEFNRAHPNNEKGVKLDFKSIEVFLGSLDILDEMVPQMDYPIWLNADIVAGPVNQTTSVPVDPVRFLAGCAHYEKAVLSIGWTTRWGPNYNDESYAYMPNQIEDMLDAIKTNNVTQPITFPVRAGIAANSQTQLHDLVRAVNETNDCTITIWSSENDYVNVEKLRNLIFSFGFDRVYLDVPESLASQLDLGRENGASALMPRPYLLNAAIIASVCLLLLKWL